MNCDGINAWVLRGDVRRELDDGKLAEGVSGTAGHDVKTCHGGEVDDCHWLFIQEL